MTKQKMYATVFVYAIILAAVLIGAWITPHLLSWWMRL